MKKDDSAYLKHILDAICQIEEYVHGVSLEQFKQTKLIQDGVIREREIIGEASRNLSDDLCRNHPETPWKHIISLRNRVIHAYFDVDLLAVWEIVIEDLPLLREQVKQILKEQRKNP
jgi:uncharacterized protein with HEPN domain